MSSSVKATCVKLGFLLLFCECVRSFIIPDEIPTVLSLVYSNIPPIKKGTDSRLGIGFRLGEHADVQFIVELGPQIETDAIGKSSANRRRDAMLMAAMRGDMGPWAQAVAKYQTERKIKQQLEKIKKLEMKSSKIKQNGDKGNVKKVESNDWLTKWSKEMLNPGEGKNEVPVKSANVQRISLASVQSKTVETKTDDNLKISNSMKDVMDKLYKSETNNTQ